MPTQGPYVDAQVLDPASVGGELVIRWGGTQDAAFRIRVLHSSDKPVLLIKNEGTKGAIVVQGGGKEFAFKSVSDGLEIRAGNEGASNTLVLKLGTTKPSVTGAKGNNLALTSLLQALEALELIEDNTTA